ncbi:MAG: hypothetical protein GY861_03625, partial [bacterium]|nr:hypothetical protein [bacterium]
FGETKTRLDGYFDMVANGGVTYTLNFSRPGYLTSQRKIKAYWEEFSTIDNIAMMPVDTQVTKINMNDPNYQVHQSSVSSDNHGQRQFTVAVPSNTTAQMILKDGSQQSLSETIRKEEHIFLPYLLEITHLSLK